MGAETVVFESLTCGAKPKIDEVSQYPKGAVMTALLQGLLPENYVIPDD